MIRNIVVLALIPAAIIPSPAAQLKEARVTEVVKDVKLLPSGGAPLSDEDEKGGLHGQSLVARTRVRVLREVCLTLRKHH